MKLLYIARTTAPEKVTLPRFQSALRQVADVTLLENGEQFAPETLCAHMRSTDVLLTDWRSVPLPAELAEAPGNLRYVCHLTGSIQKIIPEEIIRAGIPVTNWGDAPSMELAESALTLLLAVLKDLPARIRGVEAGGWGNLTGLRQGRLHGLRVGIYGFGVSGVALYELLKPFRAKIFVYDPFVHHLPEDVTQVHTLAELFDQSHAISIHAALTPETRKSIDADLLARLPDGAVLVNTARGDIIDQEALFAELESGRLRAGLDVLAGKDWLPPEHPARAWPNLLLTCHQLNNGFWPDPEALQPYHEVCLDNLRRFANGEPLRFAFDLTRMQRST